MKSQKKTALIKSQDKPEKRKRLTPKDIQAIKLKYLEYIQETDIPIVNDFAFRMQMRRETLYQNKVLREITELAVLKKLAALERGMVTGTLPVAGCIFALKQHGWKDRQEVETKVIDKKKARKELERMFE